jgi:hypothetical protein
MPSAATRADFRSRAGAVAVVLVGHVAVLALLTAGRESKTGADDDERMTLVFVAPLAELRPVAPVGRPKRAPRAPAAAPAAAPEPAAGDARAVQAPDASGVDWYSDGSAAARRAAAEPTTRDFGFPTRAPAPREKKPFGWDEAHTDRVHALEGGGIGIRLSDNCELVLLPLPLGGCTLGKRKARGDLFDEMKAPVEPGDWK